jgi:hypothetical protein
MILLFWGVKILLYTRKSYYNSLIHLDFDQVGKIQRLGKFVGNLTKFNKSLQIKFIKRYSTSETTRNETFKIKNISEHITKKKSLEDLSDKEFGFYLAGLIEADGYFSPQNQIIITFCLNDKNFAYLLKKKIGFGHISDIKNKKVCNLIITNKVGIIKIINLINGKIRLENKLIQLKNLVRINNLNISILELDTLNYLNSTYWLSGFADGDSSFQIKIRKKGFRKEIALNFQIDQKKDFILKDLKENFGGYVGYHKMNDTYYYGSSGFLNAYKYINYFDSFSLQSSKYLNFIFWRKTYLLIQKNKHLTEEGQLKIEKFKNSLNSKLKVIINSEENI